MRHRRKPSYFLAYTRPMISGLRFEGFVLFRETARGYGGELVVCVFAKSNGSSQLPSLPRVVTGKILAVVVQYCIRGMA